MGMDIKFAQEQKEAMEREIRLAIEKFERMTGLLVSGIDFNTGIRLRLSGMPERITQIKTTVTI